MKVPQATSLSANIQQQAQAMILIYSIMAVLTVIINKGSFTSARICYLAISYSYTLRSFHFDFVFLLQMKMTLMSQSVLPLPLLVSV